MPKKEKKIKLSPVEEFVEFYLKMNVKLNADEIERCYQNYKADVRKREIEKVKAKFPDLTWQKLMASILNSMKESIIEVKDHSDIVNFMLVQSQIDKHDFELAHEKGFNLPFNISLNDLYYVVKRIKFDDTDYKSQLLSRPIAILFDKPRYVNCAGKVYFFVCLLRWMREKNYPVGNNRFYISLAGKKNISHIYIEVDLKGKLFPFDFTYDTKQNAILFPLLESEKIKYRIEII